MNFSHAMTLRVLPLALACLTALTVQAQGLRPSGGGAMRLPSAAGVLPPAGGAASAAVRQADYIVAVVNSEPITNNEVRTADGKQIQRETEQLLSDQTCRQ